MTQLESIEASQNTIRVGSKVENNQAKASIFEYQYHWVE